MNISQVNQTQSTINFNGQPQTVEKDKSSKEKNKLFSKKSAEEKKHSVKKDDPLQKFPLRAIAYSNEVGAALAPLPGVGQTGMLISFAPALLWIGADCQDKYLRGDKDDYSEPSKKRLASEVTTQLLASVILPTVFVHIGQNLGMLAYRAFEKCHNLDGRAQLEIIDSLKKFTSSGGMKNYTDTNENEIFNNFITQLNSNSEKQALKTTGQKIKQGIQRFYKGHEPEHGKYKFVDLTIGSNEIKPESNAYKFAQEQFTSMVKEYKILNEIDFSTLNEAKKSLNNNKDVKINIKKFEKLYDKYKKLQGDNSDLFKTTIINEMLSDSILKKSLKGGPLLVKIISGFASLFIFAGLIDKFVEHVVMEKCLNKVYDRIDVSLKAIKQANKNNNNNLEIKENTQDANSKENLEEKNSDLLQEIEQTEQNNSLENVDNEEITEVLQSNLKEENEKTDLQN